jgi:hypothetical protein
MKMKMIPAPAPGRARGAAGAAMLAPLALLVLSIPTHALAAQATTVAWPDSTTTHVAAMSARQTSAPAIVPAAVPFSTGEELVYHATFGKLPAGTARMRVVGIDTVRGRPAYHLLFTIDGGILFYRVHDRYESWIDVATLASLRHHQQISEGGYKRTTTYEIYPDRALYKKNDEPLQPSVHHPLDDGSFIYAVRVAAIAPGDSISDNRYFRPDRNPVVLKGVKRDTISVGAGTFATTIVKPTIHANGIFADGGEAQVWFSDDAHRYPVLLKTKFAHFTLTLSLESITPATGVVSPKP